MGNAESQAMENFRNFGEESPKRFIYEDDQCVAFDVKKEQQAPVHFLVAPKKAIPRISDVTEDDEKLIGHLLLIAKNIALEKGLGKSGYHVIIDENHSSMRLKSIHVFGTALHHMLWPLGPGAKL